jgi:hypothetical protein
MSVALADAFGTQDPLALAKRFEGFKTALAAEWMKTASGETRLNDGWHRTDEGKIAGQGRLIEKVDLGDMVGRFVGDPLITKAVSAEALASLRGQIDVYRAAQADLVKDITTASPLASGLVPFDLEAPAKLLTPVLTPLRNKTPRQRGSGLVRRYKRITGFSGTRTGGTAGNVLRHGIGETSQNDFSMGGATALKLIRGPKVSYAADDQTLNYKQFSVSDQVSWEAQYAGQGFQDVRQLSQFVVLNAHMLSDEAIMLGGRGTDSMFQGALAAPTTVSATPRAAAAGEVGITGVGSGGTNIYLKVTAQAVFGESVPSTVATCNIAVGVTNVVDVKIGGEPVGTLGYNIYANKADTNGADPGDASRFIQGRTGYNTFTIGANGQAALFTVAPAVPTGGDTSASALDFDGFLTILGGPNSGYTKRLNSALSTSNPGTEFQAAFLSLWRSVKADPEEIWLEAGDSAQLSDLLKTSSSSNYRLSVVQNEFGNVIMGNIVTGILNEASPTRRMVDIRIHPYIPQGNAMILTWTLPIPNSQVPSCWEMTMVQDYMSIAWPVLQFSWDVSTYAFGALTGYAPAWSGLIQGIKPTY